MINERSDGGGPLAGLRVVDATATIGAYASRLFADLGADVIRIEPPASASADGSAQAEHHRRFANAGKRSLRLDLRAPKGRAILHRLLERSDALIESFHPSWADANGLGPADVAERHPRLVHVAVSSHGRDRADGVVEDDDIALLGAGGLLHLGGYPDTEPLAAWGRQSHMAASLFSAVAALVALLERERSGHAGFADVSAQECVAQAVEDSVATYELTGHVRNRLGGEPREAGSGIYPCADGYVTMVAGRLGTAKAWQALVDWMIEDGVPGADELTAPEWSTLHHRQRPESIARFAELFAGFAGERTRLQLYRDAQSRGIALSPVNDIAAVLADPQLRAREFFVTVHDPELGRDLVYPGPPYRLSATPASPARAARRPGADTDSVLRGDLGMSDAEVDELQRAGAA